MRVRLVLGLVVLAACRREPASPASPPTAERPAAPAQPRPSVLLVTLDTTRASALGCYGAPEWSTPNLDALARRGVRFESARAPAPVTMPAHATILTGLFPFEHGVRDNGTFVLASEVLTLAERLKQAGWVTAAVPAAMVVDSTYGLAQGFDRYFDLSQKEFSIEEDGQARPGEEVTRIATTWLKTLKPDARFFLWVHYFDSHYPYAPPEDLVAAHPFEKPEGARPVEVNAALQRHLYQLEVAEVDRQVATLLGALDRFGGAEQVITIVVGDHGEGLGQHGEATHAALVYDATLRVPFLIAHASLPKGKVVVPAVSTVDVAPTLLALLGLDAAGTSGADLAPLWSDRPLASERPLYFENCATWFTSGWAPLYGVVVGDFKTIRGPQVRVFDVARDPDEKQDVAADHPEVVSEAAALLQDLAQRTIAAPRHVPDAAELEGLASLGYLATNESSRRDSLVPPGWQPKEALTPEQGLGNTRRFTEANRLWKVGKKKEGAEALAALAEEEPQNAHYAQIAAALLSELGRHAEALPLAIRANQLAETPGSLVTVGACLLALGRKDEAFDLLNYTVKRYPRLMPPRLSLAQLMLDRNQWRPAAEQLEIFLAGFEGDPKTRQRAQQLLARARTGR
jgi:arylsulfatase A-like enzyme